MRRRKLTDVLEKGGVPIIERAAFKVVIHRAMVRRRSDTGRQFVAKWHDPLKIARQTIAAYQRTCAA